MSKNILLTGSSGGMGAVTARFLCEQGFEVYGLDIVECEEYEHFHFYKTDLTNEHSIIETYELIKSNNINFDIIIHQAGIYDLNSLIEMEEKDFTRIFDINLFSVFRINKHFIDLLNPNGKIIITSSELAPLDPLPFTGIYGITKTAVEKYAYSLRMELQLLNYQVVIVRPGAIETKLLDVSTQKLDKFVNSTDHYQTNSRRFKRIVDKIESKKIPPIKIAKLVYKIIKKKKTKYVYIINRNFGLLLLNALPDRLQNFIIKKILK